MEKSEQKKELNVIEGVISSGSLKGKSFLLYLGDTPAQSQLVLNNMIVPFSKAEIVIDREKSSTLVTFNYWFFPEE